MKYKNFLLNPEKKKKILAQIHLVVLEKNTKNTHYNSEKHTKKHTKLKVGYSNN